MKKFYTILCLTIASLTQLQAQAPQGFNYQATVRNSAGDLIVNTNVYFKFNVIQGSQTAVPIFTETHYVPTDDLGQVNLVIGQGTANTGIFSELDWSLGSYYLGIELNTGSGYVAMGTTQLLSVPYALYAENSGNSTPTTPNLETVLAENNSANNQQIKDLQDPTEAHDAATKAYIDAQIAEAVAGLQSQIDDLDSDNATLNQDLVGSWYGTSVDNSQPPTTEEIQITLESNGEGYTIFDRYDQDNNLILEREYDVTWSSTANTITINYIDYGPDGQQYIDSQTNSYEFIDTDSFRFFEDDGDVTILYRGSSVTDQDGNTYDYLTYGDQVWTVENAEMVTYRDGTPIPQVTDNTEWESLTKGAWAYYDNDPTKPRLYNWYAVMGIHDTDPNTPNKVFAPEGWHVPTDAEWTTLEEYLIASGYNYDGTTTENKIAKAMASTTGWNSSTDVGAIGNDQSLNNDSGFNAFPEGGRSINGSFLDEGSGAVFWSSTEVDTNNAWYRNLYGNSSSLSRSNYPKRGGFSVRFVRDSEVNSNAQVNPIDDIYVCPGDDAYAEVSTTNTQGTTQYYWTNDNDSTGIPLSGVSQRRVLGYGVYNATSEPQVSTITVTPELTFQGQTTTGPSETFTVTVNPTAQVNQVEDITVNSGEIVQPNSFTSSNTIGYTTYSWTNDLTSLGLPSSGSGDITAFTTINSTTTPITGTITVTPNFNNGGVACN
ncbi:fibrobacter succinogenes major paralogous domain-containing protein, partial [Flavobacteriaceae bacterium]|nr:fibrobacter succinogenes major paralogous domain-containing protein [Flavobacteriaceae bacterium]